METGLLVLAVAVVVAAVLVSRRPGAPSAGPRDGDLTSRLDSALSVLSGLAGAFEERRRLEEQAVEALGRVERLVAGSRARGRSGEQLLAAALAELPPEFLVRDFTIGGRVCEFALRMPDGKLLPVDSKWPASDLAARLGAAEGAELEDLERRIEKVVCTRVKEVAGYLDAGRTVPVAVAAVPDSVYACCRRAHAVAHAARVLIVPYSLALPFLLGMWSLHRTYAADLDAAMLQERVHDVAVTLTQLGERLEGQLSRALKMATNATSEMRSLVVGAQTSLRVLEGAGLDGTPLAVAVGDASDAC